jgi:hypothetical protein
VPKQKRGLAELIKIEWEEIDRLINLIKSRKSAKGAALGAKERFRYSMALAAHVHRLDKLLWKAGVGKLDEESLAKLLEKVPKKYKDMVLRRVRKYAKTRHAEKG